jgi:hypothetical protein
MGPAGGVSNGVAPEALFPPSLCSPNPPQATSALRRDLAQWQAEPAALQGLGAEELGELAARMEAALSRVRAAQLQVGAGRRGWRVQSVGWAGWPCLAARCRRAVGRRRGCQDPNATS